MARLVHVSDLHFGRVRPELVWPLIAQLNALAPDLIVISGDLTQRAHPPEFRAARTFMSRLKPPLLVVPGNHDIPVWRPLARCVQPFGLYRRWICQDPEPSFTHAGMTVIGLNTVNPLVWQRGRIGRRAMRRTRRAIENAEGAVRILVAHHPLEHLPDDTKALMHGAARAVDAFAECGVDIVLGGHLHTWRAGLLTARRGGRSLIRVLAGTGLSTRLRGGENDFNLLTVGPDEVIVERYAAGASETVFEPTQRAIFYLSSLGWQAAPEIGATS